MNTLVKIHSLQPATADEIRSALKALFGQFPAQDGDAPGKMLGYLVALEGEPLWAITQTVRKYLRGEIETHGGVFLPTSAELARAVRAQSAHARKMAELATPRVPMVEYLPGPEESARIAAKADALIVELARTAADDEFKQDMANGLQATLTKIADAARERGYVSTRKGWPDFPSGPKGNGEAE